MSEAKPMTTTQPAVALEQNAAIKTLVSLGYTYHGGERWKPPLGKPPTWLTQPLTWVGLTDEELKKLQDESWTECEGGGYDWNTFEYARAIEAKLKEKNTNA